MKIGEFAKMCGTKISVLRHYDKEKLLEPQYTDIFRVTDIIALSRFLFFTESML